MYPFAVCNLLSRCHQNSSRCTNYCFLKSDLVPYYWKPFKFPEVLISWKTVTWKFLRNRFYLCSRYFIQNIVTRKIKSGNLQRLLYTLLQNFFVISRTQRVRKNVFLPKSAVRYSCYVKLNNVIGQMKTTNTEKIDLSVTNFVYLT